jgi:mannose-1-phosphate guanylyltransferase/mannose-6-phosphate isomerase
MKSLKVTPVILSGGQGTRLWPLSRADLPKQFIALTGEKSLFEETYERCSDPHLFNTPVIICSQPHRFLIKKLINEDSNIIMEPCGRNTAAALAIAALSAADPDDILIIMPSDHFIPDTEAFHNDIKAARALASSGHIVTLGIKPTKPHTGFGYIQKGQGNQNGYDIEAFHEKPDLETAQAYLETDAYFWNAGIFMAKASTFLQELNKHAPDILKQTHAAWGRRIDDLGDTLLDPVSFEQVRSESFDYAVAEKTEHAAMIEASFEWNDLGQWEALWSVSPKDENGNTHQGTIYAHDTENTYMRAEDGMALTAVGLKDVVAVAMKDAVFIAPKDRTEEIKHLVEEMRASEQKQLTENSFTMRPWGSYDVMEEKPGFKVKKLTVNPGAKLSLQKHEHRSEHWVVVRGTATVTRDDEIFELQANQSTYLPQGTIHRLENKHKEVLEIIEVQTGNYLGEDDIIRFEDDYNRNKTIECKAS